MNKPMTTFGIISDLHLTHYSPKARYIMLDKINNFDGDLLLICGDIYHGLETSVRFLDEVEVPYLFVPGNHEFYGDALNNWPNAAARGEVNGLSVFGTTLWTSFNGGDPVAAWAVKDGLNDSRQISDYSVGEIFVRNEVEFSELKYSNPDVVMTHHAPSIRSVHEKFEDGWPLNWGFVNDYDEFIEGSQIKLWAFGHVHHPHEYTIGNTLCVANPLGYPGETVANYKNYQIKKVTI